MPPQRTRHRFIWASYLLPAGFLVAVWVITTYGRVNIAAMCTQVRNPATSQAALRSTALMRYQNGRIDVVEACEGAIYWVTFDPTLITPDMKTGWRFEWGEFTPGMFWYETNGFVWPGWRSLGPSMPNGYVLPFWTLLAAITLPYAVGYGIHRRRRRHYLRTTGAAFRWVRRPDWMIRLAALFGFVMSFMATYIAMYVLDNALLVRGYGQLVPSWAYMIPPTLVSLFVAALIVSWVQWKRVWQLPQSCASCGYSLAGNTSGRCPECGTPSNGVE